MAWLQHDDQEAAAASCHSLNALLEIHGDVGGRSHQLFA
jgi:hypothetical protein